jgi:hypothetical protein
MRNHQLAAAACALALTGCVSVEHIPMTASTDALKGREISLSERPRPDFGAMTAGRMAGGALFGVIGGAVAGGAMVSAGNDIVQQNTIQDPAEHIGAALGGALAAKFAARANAPRMQLSTDEVAEVAKNASGTDLVLDVRTINWGFVYFPTSWSKYRVMYSARTRLIDAKKGQVLAEAGCAAPVAENADAAPTYDEMLADGAARLKKELAQAADHCAGEFASKMFSLDLAQVRAAPAPAASAVMPLAMAAAAPAAAAKAAPARAAARPGALAAGQLPPAGSVWRYSMRDRVFSNRNRDFSVQLARVDGSNVMEIVSSDGQQESYSVNSHDLSFYQRRMAGESVLELAPYLLAHLPKPQAPLGRTPESYPSGGLGQPWQLRVTEVRSESVSVPAGRYEAVRIGVAGENPGAQSATSSLYGGAGAVASDYRTYRFEYTVWYVPELGRYVQARHRIFNRMGHEIGDETVQLTKFEPGTSAAQAKGQ